MARTRKVAGGKRMAISLSTASFRDIGSLTLRRDAGRARRPEMSRCPLTAAVFELLQIQSYPNGDSLFSRSLTRIPKDTAKNRKHGAVGRSKVRSDSMAGGLVE
jgi:hypothetical protein